jgi:tight adherence protein C
VQTIFLILIWASAATLYLVLYRLRGRKRSLDRLAAFEAGAPVADLFDEPGRLHRWLYLAGYRSPDAAAWFVSVLLAAALAGSLSVILVYRANLISAGVAVTRAIPGGIGEVFQPIVYCVPWMTLGCFIALPFAAVRRRRRLRVEQVEQDLPLSLELLATLSEAGLGFDAALHRILESGLAHRVLAGEFRSFQADLVGGRSRVDALRRFGKRLEVTTITILVSALVQAEQLGTGIAHVLRRQADDLRDRRRERANAFAASLTVKRMFPMVLCFLPALFVWTLGPAFTELFRMADTLMRTRGH